MCQRMLSLLPMETIQSPTVYLPQPANEPEHTLVVKATLMSSAAVADPRELLELCTCTLADLTTTPQFAQYLLERDEDPGMDAFMSVLSTVMQMETVRCPAESDETATLLHVSRIVANLVGSDNAGCLSELVGGAVFASGLF